jgi:hypothetical protein
MKKRILFLSLLLVVAMTFIGAAPVSAADKCSSISAVGYIDGITPGNVKQVGHSEWWRVNEREITGAVSGGISGDFSLVYQGLFKITTQEGILKGTFTVTGETPCVLQVVGASAPLKMVATPTPYGTFDLPKLTIKGTWKYAKGGKGNGTFSAWIIFIPDEYGHVDTIIASEIKLQGR